MKNISLIGTAHIHTPGFVKRLNARNDIKVISVWDHDQIRAQQNADLLNSKTIKDYTSVLNNPDLDAVIICSESCWPIPKGFSAKQCFFASATFMMISS